MPPQPLVVSADSDKENSPAGATPTAAIRAVRNKATDAPFGGDVGAAVRATPLTPKSQPAELKQQGPRAVPLVGVTASVLFDTHWTGAAGSPHPIKDLSERHRDKLIAMEAVKEAAVAANGSPAGRVRELAAKLEAASSPCVCSAAMKEPHSGLSSPAACHTPTLRPMPSLRAHPLSESILEDALPCLASTQLSTLKLPPVVESPDVIPKETTSTTTSCCPDEVDLVHEQAEVASNTDPPPTKSSVATSCEGLPGKMTLPIVMESSVPRTCEASCNTEGGSDNLVSSSSAVATSCELPATKAAEAQTVLCASEVDAAGEVTMELMRETEELRMRLERAEAELHSARRELEEERQRQEQQMSISSSSTSSATPAAPTPAHTASPMSSVTPASALASPFALTHTVGRLRMAIQRQAQEHAELAEFAEAERSVIEVAEAELEEALKKERGRVNVMRKRVDAMRRESTGKLAKEQEARIELEASLRASEKERKMLQARMDDMLREGKYTPDQLQAALHNLRQSETELATVVDANKEMLHELAGVYKDLKAHSAQFADVPVITKLLSQLQRWEKAREMQERMGSSAVYKQ